MKGSSWTSNVEQRARRQISHTFAESIGKLSDIGIAAAKSTAWITNKNPNQFVKRVIPAERRSRAEPGPIVPLLDGSRIAQRARPG
jgi:hypothetical protein